MESLRIEREKSANQQKLEEMETFLLTLQSDMQIKEIQATVDELNHEVDLERLKQEYIED